MRAELDVARQLQQMLLPKKRELTQIEGLDIVGFMQPAEEVGGDYYDVLQDDNRLILGIGDVIGHGLESGVFAIMVQSIVRGLLVAGVSDPFKFLNALNQAVYANVQRIGSDKNLSFGFAEYQNKMLRLTGQHETAIVVRNGNTELIDTEGLGFPIGLVADISGYISATDIALDAGDGIVLYTDGITEAANSQDQEYGITRLCHIIQQNWQHPAASVCQAIVDDVHRHIADQRMFDDITLLILKIK